MRNLAGRGVGWRSAAGRAVIAAAALAGVVSGCTGGPGSAGAHGSATPRPPGSISGAAATLAGSGSALNLSGLHAVRPCPGTPGFSCGLLTVRLDPFGPA